MFSKSPKPVAARILLKESSATQIYTSSSAFSVWVRRQLVRRLDCVSAALQTPSFADSLPPSECPRRSPWSAHISSRIPNLTQQCRDFVNNSQALSAVQRPSPPPKCKDFVKNSVGVWLPSCRMVQHTVSHAPVETGISPKNSGRVKNVVK